jgi:outer membrane protein TolC
MFAHSLLAVVTKSILFLSIVVSAVAAQPLLREEDAVLAALQNNFALRIAGNAQRIAENNAYAGNANNPNAGPAATGLLPTIVWTGNIQKNIQQNRQQTQTDAGGNVVGIAQRTNVGLLTAGTNVTVNWTLFNGLSGVYFYRQLKTLAQLADNNTQAAIDSVTAATLAAYYDIVQQKQILEVRKSATIITEERLRIAEEREKIGAGSRLEYLQAVVDLNTDRSALLRQEAVLSNAKVTLNNLLARELATTFDVVNDIGVDSSLSLAPLLNNFDNYNQSLKAIAARMRSLDYTLKMQRANRLPTINVFAAYNYFQSLSDPFAQGFNPAPLYIQTVGPQFGANFSWLLFNGATLKRSIGNIRIQQSTLQYQQESVKLRLGADVRRNYENYRNALQLVKLEEENLSVSKRNADVALERFKIGSSNSIELRTAQSSYIEALGRRVAAQFSAKQAEIELKRLTGKYSSENARP